jgi:hypothetical protein
VGWGWHLVSRARHIGRGGRRKEADMGAEARLRRRGRSYERPMRALL